MRSRPVAADASIAVPAELMFAGLVDALCVVNHDRGALGIVTWSDILRRVAGSAAASPNASMSALDPCSPGVAHAIGLAPCCCASERLSVRATSRQCRQGAPSDPTPASTRNVTEVCRPATFLMLMRFVVLALPDVDPHDSRDRAHEDLR